MKLRKLLVPVMVTMFALAAAAVPGFAISKDFDQSYPLQPGGTFELQNVNGTLRVAGVDEVKELHSVNGNIEVYGADSTVHARTTNGNVRLEISRVHGVVGTFAETTNGSVILALPADTQADLEARSLNGNFQSELPVEMQSSLKPREMHGKLGQGGVPIKLHTVNGGIRVLALRTTV